MGNRLDREENRIFKMRTLALIEGLDRRISELEDWRDRVIARDRAIIRRINERVRNHPNERNRSLVRILERFNRSFNHHPRSNFSNYIEGELQKCEICLEELISNYYQCNLCHNNWCLDCQIRLHHCPYCRN